MKARLRTFSTGQRRWLSSHGSQRHGTTLIEVLAGLVVLGTLVASVTIARGRFLRQWAEADRKIRATHAADAMLAAWLNGPGSTAPMSASGAVPSDPEFGWRTSVVADRAAGQLGAMIIRLQILDEMGHTMGGRPVVSVDFLMRKPPPATQPVRAGSAR